MLYHPYHLTLKRERKEKKNIHKFLYDIYSFREKKKKLTAIHVNYVSSPEQLGKEKIIT